LRSKCRAQPRQHQNLLDHWRALPSRVGRRQLLHLLLQARGQLLDLLQAVLLGKGL
jgi:hypothetical protein